MVEEMEARVERTMVLGPKIRLRLPDAVSDLHDTFDEVTFLKQI